VKCAEITVKASAARGNGGRKKKRAVWFPLGKAAER